MMTAREMTATEERLLAEMAARYGALIAKGHEDMIRNPNEIREGEKKIRMLIAGYPGIGKSTLALSAPKPLHIDVDFGIDRIEPRYRKPYIQPATYEEILDDLTPENVRDFETLVFDTGGKLVTLIGQWAIRQNPKNGKRDGSLSQQGYGAVGREFVKLMDHCFYVLRKHIVIVFHAIEDKDNEVTRLRIKVEGGTKNNVWEPMDLGGFMEMYGNDRTIGFSNCERYFAKGTRGIHGILKIPALTPDAPNDFLTRLFADYNAQAAAEVQRDSAEKEKYEAAMNAGRDIIATVTDAESANAALEKFRAIEHALTSQRELRDLWNANAKNRGLYYDKGLQRYTLAPKRPARKKSAATRDKSPAAQPPQDDAPVSQGATQDDASPQVPQDAKAQENAPAPQDAAPQGDEESGGE